MWITHAILHISYDPYGTKKWHFAMHIQNLFFKTIKILIHFVASLTWICACKVKLENRVITINDVKNKPNLNVLLKSHIGYYELENIHTSPQYIK